MVRPSGKFLYFLDKKNPVTNSVHRFGFPIAPDEDGKWPCPQSAKCGSTTRYGSYSALCTHAKSHNSYEPWPTERLRLPDSEHQEQEPAEQQEQEPEEQHPLVPQDPLADKLRAPTGPTASHAPNAPIDPSLKDATHNPRVVSPAPSGADIGVESVYETHSQHAARVAATVAPLSEARAPTSEQGLVPMDVDSTVNTRPAPVNPGTPVSPSDLDQIPVEHPEPQLLRDPQRRHPSHLYMTPSMIQAGYYVNVHYRLLICSDCRRPHLPTALPGHIHRAHKYRMSAQDLREIEELISKYKIPSSHKDVLASLPPCPRRPIEGADIFLDGWACSLCAYACHSLAMIDKHYTRDHQVSPTSKRQVPVQNLYLNSNINFWMAVEPDLIDTLPTDPLALFVAEKLPELPLVGSTDDREIPPFVKTLHWHDLVKDLDPRAVITLLQLARGTQPYAWIQKTVDRYFDDTHALLLKLDDTTRGWIQSNNDTIHPRGFHTLQSMSSYAIPIARYLSAIFRTLPSESPGVPVPMALYPPQLDALSAFQTSYDTCAQDPQHAHVVSAFHRVLTSLIRYEFPPDHLQWNDPIARCFAYHQLRHDGSFQNPRDGGTKELAAMEFVAKCWLTHEVCHEAPTSGGYFKACQMLRKFTIIGPNTPMTSLWRTQALLQSVAADELSKPRFSYLDPTCQRWEFDGQTSTVTAVGQVINTCIKEAEDIFADQLLLGYPLKSFGLPPLKDIIDDASHKEVGYSFLTDERNNLGRFKNSLMTRIMNDPDPDKAHTFHSGVADGKLLYKPGACRRYLESGQDFLKRYVPGCHMSHGQPSRGMELFTATWRTVGNSEVSLRMTDGELYICISFHKPDTVKTHRFLVPYFQCSRLSQLGFAYMVLVRPLEIRFALKVCPPAAPLYNTYLFTGPSGRWVTDNLTKSLEEVTSQVLGFKLGTQKLRQVLIFILHRHAGAFFLQPDREVGEHEEPQALMAEQAFDALGDFTAAHSGLTARNEYGIEVRTVGAMPEEKLRHIRFYAHRVHRLWGLRGPDPKTVTQVSAQRRGESQTLHVEFQATAAAIWSHLQSRFDEEGPAMLARALHTHAGPAVLPLQPEYPPQLLPDVSLLQHLLDFSHGKYLQFTSPHQAQALQAVRDRAENLCVVIPTGVGKSLLWMLPAATFEKTFTSIVIVPFRALMEDFKRNCDLHDVSCQEWNTNNKFPMAPVVLVALEHLKDSSFQSYAHRLCTLQRLGRIVIEEGHIAITSLQYRNTSSIASLFLLPTQIVLISATIPPTAVNTLERLLGIRRPFQVIRSSTVRKNIKMRHQLMDSDEACDQATVQTVSYHRQTFTAADRFLVFTRTLAKTKKIARALNVPFYDRDLTPAEKKEVLRKFVTGEVLGVVATTAFGQGINVPGVRLVVHDELPYDQIEYSQQSGRGGRDGRPCYSYVYANRYKKPIPPVPDILGVGSLVEMVWDQEECARIPLTSFIDGIEFTRNCLLAGALPCDVCIRKGYPQAAADAALAPQVAAPIVHPSHYVPNTPSASSDYPALPPPSFSIVPLRASQTIETGSGSVLGKRATCEDRPESHSRAKKPRLGPFTSSQPMHRRPTASANPSHSISALFPDARSPQGSQCSTTTSKRKSRRVYGFGKPIRAPRGPAPTPSSVAPSTSSQARPQPPSPHPGPHRHPPPPPPGAYARPPPPARLPVHRPPRPDTPSAPAPNEARGLLPPNLPPPGAGVLWQNIAALDVNRQASKAGALLQDALNKMRPYCIICWMADGRYTTAHSTDKCYSGGRAGCFFGWSKLNRPFPPGPCWKCWLPEIGTGPHTGPQYTRTECAYRDIVGPTAWAAFLNPFIRPRLLARFGLAADADLATYSKWAVALAEGHGDRFNAVDVFLFVYDLMLQLDDVD